MLPTPAGSPMDEPVHALAAHAFQSGPCDLCDGTEQARHHQVPCDQRHDGLRTPRPQREPVLLHPLRLQFTDGHLRQFIRWHAQLFEQITERTELPAGHEDATTAPVMDGLDGDIEPVSEVRPRDVVRLEYGAEHRTSSSEE